jgi:hypothetical protein
MKLVGLTKAAAINLLQAAGHSYRIVKEDQKSFMVTADVCFTRCNLTIKKGVVTEATYG